MPHSTFWHSLPSILERPVHWEEGVDDASRRYACISTALAVPNQLSLSLHTHCSRMVNETHLEKVYNGILTGDEAAHHSEDTSPCWGRCEEVLAGLEEVGGGCALCGCPDFTRGAFSERTMLLCDQCEREFHVGCLRDAGRGEVLGDTLPQGLVHFPFTCLSFTDPSRLCCARRIVVAFVGVYGPM